MGQDRSSISSHLSFETVRFPDRLFMSLALTEGAAETESEESSVND